MSSSTTIFLCLGIFFGITAFCATTLCRSMITKLVGPFEIGKVFAVNGSIQVRLKHLNIKKNLIRIVCIRFSLHFLSFRLFCNFQALMPFAASPTFGLLYRSTVAHFPQAFLFLIIAVYILVEYNEF